jgi:hypothetical protein
VDVSLELPAVSPDAAVDGMRRSYTAAFGRGWVGRRLARAAWPPFRISLLHGSGADVAAAHAQLAALDRNQRVMLVARWHRRRVLRTVEIAVVQALNSA